MDALRKLVPMIVWCAWSVPTFACSLGFIEHEAAFQGGRADLSAGEILRLADWRAELRRSVPNGGRYSVYVRQNASVGVSAGLAEQRRRYLMSTLSNLGIRTDDLDVSIVRRFSEDLKPSKELLRLTNLAYVLIDPRCPHPCCPGPQPIDAKSNDWRNDGQNE
ncbi:hypothetical protein P3W85_11760 [Cupriavidus basilensis]|uniref:OmpA family protein n=1 Tax=Cupriavidus basilensis TaxID=68895 RepID=A0ABT6AMF6_9BURK|nr:hypothetical protein [Cupriavidus basilensis]MDF3833619.1 hypothetical protein [Cupriavidus basilensis]